MRQARADTEEMIQKLVSSYFSLNKENLPDGICETCKRVLSSHTKVEPYWTYKTYKKISKNEFIFQDPDNGRKFPPRCFMRK